jgi:hypothetical protein
MKFVTRLLPATVAFSLISVSAFAYPKPTDVAYKSDRGVDGQIVVYRDNENPNLYWFLPMIKLYTVNGKAKMIKTPNSQNGFDYTFFIVPYFPDDAVDEVMRASGVTNLTNRSQLQEVVAKKFGVKLPLFNNIVGMSDDVAEKEYLNIPQLIHLSLSATEAPLFDALYAGAPGVPVDTMIKYEAERVDKAISVKLSYKEIFSSLGVGVGGHVYFTGAQIENTVSKLESSGDLEIHTTNDMTLRPLVQQLISQAFTPSTQPCTNQNNYNSSGSSGWGSSNNGWGSSTSNNGWGNTGSSDWSTTPTTTNNTASGWSQFFANYEPAARLNANDDWTPPTGASPTPTPTPSASPSPWGSGWGSSGTSTGSGWGSDTPTPVPSTTDDNYSSQPGAWSNDPRYTGACFPDTTSGGGTEMVQILFSVNHQSLNRTDSFVYNEDNTTSADEIADVPGFILETPDAPSTDIVTPLQTRTLEVGYDSKISRPLNAEVTVHEGDRLTLNAAFNLTALSPYGGGQVHYYRWDTAWGDPYSQLYYRVGDGPWIALKNGRANIGGDSLQTGVLEFYEDRDKIWGLIDPKLSKGPGWGISPMYPLDKTYPLFDVEVTGTHSELKR